jgi:hypothetical protein
LYPIYGYHTKRRRRELSEYFYVGIVLFLRGSVVVHSRHLDSRHRLSLSSLFFACNPPQPPTMEMQTATMAPPSQALHTETDTPISSPPPPEVMETNTSSQPAIKRTASAPKLSESKSLANETKDLLGRAGVAGVARRCAHYTPSLKELTSTSFSDYIRGEVLGVPLPGYEFLYVYDDAKESNKGAAAPCSTPPLCQEAPPVTVVPASQQISPLPALPKTERVMRTRSQSKATSSAKKAPTKLAGSKRAHIPEPKKYKMCWYKLRDGIAKVSLPAGFGAKVDVTARGRLVSVYI